ncbi:DUF6612 family protein [Paenibacillus qinlingensis]|uniref:Lipoprotein n=1 Tax=Paenibacillus qinlingensis TaxID=1837343 RepID=A0ABU1NWU3_9BACL|nr:DUF6612 family protein [Paenibacillus qinlingensis]MDR6551556.1 hypothetical protein [Paenibacillus qinlingensis]
MKSYMKLFHALSFILVCLLINACGSTSVEQVQSNATAQPTPTPTLVFDPATAYTAALNTASKLNSANVGVSIVKSIEIMPGANMTGKFIFQTDVILKPEVLLAGKVTLDMMGSKVDSEFYSSKGIMYVKGKDKWGKDIGNEETLSAIHYNPVKQLELLKAASDQVTAKDLGDSYEFRLATTAEKQKDFLAANFSKIFAENHVLAKEKLEVKVLDYVLTFDKKTNQIKSAHALVEMYELKEKNEKEHSTYTMDANYSSYNEVQAISEPAGLVK